jgi:hypothetical protein
MTKELPMKRAAFLALAVLTLAAPLAHAEVKTFPAAKIQLDVPAGWTADTKESKMMLVDPKNEVRFIIAVTEASDLGKAAAGLDAQLGKVATDMKWKAEKPAPIKHNGMDGFANKGTAKLNGKDVETAVLVLMTPSGKALLVFGAVLAAKKADHKATVDTFVQSIKPAA